MKEAILILVGVIFAIVSIIVLVTDIKADRKRDKEKLSEMEFGEEDRDIQHDHDWWDKYRDICCDEKGKSLCGHCNTDTCMYHANYN